MKDNLPPLPMKSLLYETRDRFDDPLHINGYTAEQMQAYARAALERQSVLADWVPVTEDLINSQEPWLYKPLWVALKSGAVFQGIYDWRQGRNPDRFDAFGGGDFWAFDASHVMPIAFPAHPLAAHQPQPVQEPHTASKARHD